jgi:hypothetical protein
MADPALVSVSALLAGLHGLWGMGEGAWKHRHPHPDPPRHERGLSAWAYPAAVAGSKREAVLQAEFRDHRLVRLWLVWDLAAAGDEGGPDVAGQARFLDLLSQELGSPTTVVSGCLKEWKTAEVHALALGSTTVVLTAPQDALDEELEELRYDLPGCREAWATQSPPRVRGGPAALQRCSAVAAIYSVKEGDHFPIEEFSRHCGSFPTPLRVWLQLGGDREEPAFARGEACGSDRFRVEWEYPGPEFDLMNLRLEPKGEGVFRFVVGAATGNLPPSWGTSGYGVLKLCGGLSGTVTRDQGGWTAHLAPREPSSPPRIKPSDLPPAEDWVRAAGRLAPVPAPAVRRLPP